MQIMLRNVKFKFFSKVTLLLIIFAQLSIQSAAINQDPDPDPDLKSTNDLDILFTDVNEFSSVSSEIESTVTESDSESTDITTLDEESTATTEETSEETTEETILTTEAPCLIDAQVLGFNDSFINIWVYTNINASLIGCYQNSSSANGSYLRLLEDEFDYDLSDEFNELEVICTDLLPSNEYFIELPSECAQNETLLSVTTDFEELTCETNLENPYKVEVVCEPLRCISCALRFDLINLERNEIIQSITYNVENTSEKMTFYYEFDSSDCLIYKLEAILFNELLETNTSFELANDIVVFSSETSIKLTSSSNQLDMRITFNFELENNWKNCINTEAFIELIRPLDCQSSLDTETIIVYENNIVLNDPDLDVVHLIIQESPDKPFTYLTEYSVNVQILKKHDSMHIETSGFERHKTDGYLVSIRDLTSTTNSILFKWQKPPDCVKQPLVTCVGSSNNITASLFEEDEEYIGICEGLESNYYYTVVTYSENNDNNVNIDSIFTDVDSAVIKQARFEKYTLNLILNLEFIGTYDRLLLCYKDITNNQAEYTCLPQSNLNQIEPNTFEIELQNDVFFYANAYNFSVKTIGCNENCSKDSNIFPNVVSDLDKFNIVASPLIATYETSLEVALWNNSLPKENRGRLALVCRRVGSLLIPPSINCTYQMPYIMCTCINLIPGTRYNVSLENSLDGFDTRSHVLGPYYTDVSKPNLIDVYFEEFSLDGRFSFNQVGNYEGLEFCCRRREIITESYTCFNIINTTNSFGPEDINKVENILEYGREYDTIVRAIATTGKNPAESAIKIARTDLDIVKIEQSHPMTVSDREITVIFANSSLPSGSFTNISIQCLNLETKVNATRMCTHDSEKTVCRCNGGSLVPSTEYAVSLFTIKRGNFTARELYLRDIITSIKQAPRSLSCSEKETSMRIYIELGNTRINGIRLRMRKATREDMEVIEPRLETERVCTYGTEGHWPGTNCELVSNQFFYNYTLLSPGTVYFVEVRTYYNDLNSTLTTRRCSTLVDLPIFRSISIVSGNRLKVEFIPPETDNCNITFFLSEKDTNKDTYISYDKYELYQEAATDPNHRIPTSSSSIVFSRKLSSKTGVKYKVSVSVFKDITDHVATRIDYEKVYTVPFPDYLIAIIVIFGLLFIVGGPIGTYFALKEYKKRAEKYASKTLIKPEHLKDILQEWDENQNAGCEKEWSDITKESEENAKNIELKLCGNEPKNLNKNRYQDILPYEHARVKLATNDEDDNISISKNNTYIHDDYINASFIPGLQSETKYIACQAPLDRTIKDFWRMIWERYVSVIIMLANIYEQDRCTYDDKNVKQKKKCDAYWPEVVNKPILYGEMLVTLVKEINKRDFIIRKLIVETDKNKDDIKQSVTQYHYKAWPDKKFPKKESLYEFIGEIKKNMTVYDNKGPVLIHCSAGIGRTGTYLAIDPLMELIHKKKPVDIYKRVIQMRKYRPKMVQNAVQYRFIYEFLAYCYEREHNQPTYAEIELTQMNTSS